MFRSKSDRKKNLDHLIGSLLRAHIDRNQAEPDNSIPFLYQRVMARIEDEKRRRVEDGLTWGVLIREGMQVIPLLALIAVFVLGLAVTTQRVSQPVQPGTAPAIPHTLAWADIAPFSDDEMLASATASDDRNNK